MADTRQFIEVSDLVYQSAHDGGYVQLNLPAGHYAIVKMGDVIEFYEDQALTRERGRIRRWVSDWEEMRDG